MKVNELLEHITDNNCIAVKEENVISPALPDPLVAGVGEPEVLLVCNDLDLLVKLPSLQDQTQLHRRSNQLSYSDQLNHRGHLHLKIF